MHIFYHYLPSWKCVTSIDSIVSSTISCNVAYELMMKNRFFSKAFCFLLKEVQNLVLLIKNIYYLVLVYSYSSTVSCKSTGRTTKHNIT